MLIMYILLLHYSNKNSNSYFFMLYPFSIWKTNQKKLSPLNNLQVQIKTGLERMENVSKNNISRRGRE